VALSGVVSVAFGVLMLARPGAGAVAVAWLIGWFATVYGALHLVVGFRMKGLANRMVAKPA